MTLAKKSHPRHPNPTIIEAIIEIHLDKPLTNNDLNKIIEGFQKKYKTKKEKILHYTASVGEKGMSINQEDLDQYRILIQKSESILLQMFSDRLSVHWVGKYLGWEFLEIEFFNVWNEFKKRFPKIQGSKCGVRFINRVEEKLADQPLKIWLKDSPNYPKNLLDSKTNFFYRGQWNSYPSKTKNQTQVMITIAESGPNNGAVRPLLYDIDVIHSSFNPIKNDKEIYKIISHLHETIWMIFSSSISKNYKKLLQKKV